MKHLKTYENWSISLAPKGMDQELYFFLKKKLEGTKFEIVYRVGYDDENVEGIDFVEDDGIDDDDKYVAIIDTSLPTQQSDGTTNTMDDYYASNFNVMEVEKEMNDLEADDEDYLELYRILKSSIKEYKTTEGYARYIIGIEANKYNL